MWAQRRRIDHEIKTVFRVILSFNSVSGEIVGVKNAFYGGWSRV
jgi:hypothetical protein